MAHREIKVPAQTKRETIRQLEETPAYRKAKGLIRVMIVHDLLDADGEPIGEGQHETFVIDGERYEELVATKPPAWAKNKPAGTYRNEDLWHAIDELRAVPKKPTPV